MPARRASCEPMMRWPVAAVEHGIHQVDGLAGAHGGVERGEGPVGDGVAARPGRLVGTRLTDRGGDEGELGEQRRVRRPGVDRPAG